MIHLLSRPPQGKPITLLPPPTPLPLIVEVGGAVNKPGVYQIETGSRVLDAIRAAGGCLAEADTASTNLAALLTDGMRIAIPFKATPVATIPAGVRSEPVVIPDIATDTPTAVPTSSGLININTATQAELETLPRIGPATAQKIIAYREQHGPFQTIEELLDVSGIGPVTLADIRELITVGP